jgi:hypothetical protein
MRDQKERTKEEKRKKKKKEVVKVTRTTEKRTAKPESGRFTVADPA